MRGHIDRYQYPDIELRSPEPKGGMKKGQQKSAGGGRGGLKEDENQAWIALLEKATYSVHYISRHIKKEHFIREVFRLFFPTALTSHLLYFQDTIF